MALAGLPAGDQIAGETGRAIRPAALWLQTIASGDGFQFHPHCIHDGNHAMRLEFKGRECRAELVDGQRIVAFHQHVAAPIAHAHHDQLDLEIGGRFSLGEHLQNPLPGILVFHRRALRSFKPTDHVFHVKSFLVRGFSIVYVGNEREVSQCHPGGKLYLQPGIISKLKRRKPHRPIRPPE